MIRPVTSVLVLGCLLLLLSSGCAAPSGAGTERASSGVVTPSESYRLSTLWRQPVRLDGPQRERFADESAGVVLVEGAGVAVVSTERGRVVGLQLHDGSIRWEHEVAGGVVARPTVSGRDVWIAGLSGDVLVLDGTSGRVRGSLRIGEPLVSSVVLHGNRGALVSGRNTLHVFDSETMELLWQHRQRVTPDVRMRGAARPAITSAGVWAGFSDGSLVHLSPSGEIVWMRDLAEGEQRLRDVTGQVVERDGVVYATSFSGGLHALEADTGVRSWRLAVEGSAPPAFVDESTLVAISADGVVHWVDIDSGDVRERLSLERSVAGVLQHAGRFLIVPGRSDGVLILDAHRPWIHQRFNPGDGVASPVAIRDDTIVVLSNRGVAWAVRMERAGTLR